MKLGFLYLAITDLPEDVDWNQRATGRQRGGQAKLDVHVQMVLHLVARVAALSRAALEELCMLLFEIPHILLHREVVLSPHTWFSLLHMSRAC